MKMKLLAAAAAASALALTWGTAASALTTYTLTTGNAGLAGFPGPYGTVNVTLTNATTANVSFTSATPTYFFIGAQAADVNVNATTWTLSGLTGNGGALTNGGSNAVDGFGVFNQTIDQFDGFASRSSSISFTLTNTSGTWASDSLVLTANSLGNTVGAHIGACDAGCTQFLSTGFATNGGAPIPEPATWAMMILGFGGIGAMMRRRRSLAPAIV
jgi:hypothetical protein